VCDGAGFTRIRGSLRRRWSEHPSGRERQVLAHYADESVGSVLTHFAEVFVSSLLTQRGERFVVISHLFC